MTAPGFGKWLDQKSEERRSTEAKTREEDAVHYIDICAYDELVRVVTPFVGEIGSTAAVRIEKLDGQPGWMGDARMNTSEGYTMRQVIVTPTDSDDFSKPWQLVMRWSSRDCDGLHDGGQSYLLVYDGQNENNNATVRRELKDVFPTRDHTAEAAGY